MNISGDNIRCAIAGDMEPLIMRVRTFLQNTLSQSLSSEAIDYETLRRTFGYSRSKKKTAEVIIGGDIGLELGHPSTESLCFVLTTTKAELVADGLITVIGPDAGNIITKEKRPFAQVIMVATESGADIDPFSLDSAQYLMQRLDGYMVRSVPGRLWSRLSRKCMADGLDLHVVGSALADFFKHEFAGVSKAEILFVTSSAEDVLSLKPIETEASILAGKHKKLFLGLDGVVECSELNCEVCDEKPVCDSLRDIVVKRRRIKR